MFKEDLFNQISKQIHKGEHKKALSSLEKLRKIKGLTPKERHDMANYYHFLQKPEKALRIAKKELSPQELKEVTHEEFYLQSLFAHLLGYFGARYVCIRLFQNLDHEIERRGLTKFTTEFPFYLRYKAYLHFRAFDDKKSHPYFVELAKKLPENSMQQKMARVGVADTLDAMGKFSEAIAIIEDLLKDSKEEDRILRGILYQVKGEYLFREDKFKEARESFQESFKYFGNDVHTKDFAYLLRWSGALAIEEKQFALAKEQLEQAFKVLNHDKSEPITLLEVIYWLSKLPNYKLSYGQELALKAHHSFTPYSYLAGRQWNKENAIPLSSWFQKQIGNVKEDCWLIHHDTIKSISYQEEIKTLWQGHENILDLKGGLIKKEKKVEVLSEIQNHAIASVLGTGDLGMSEWALIDFIYRQEFFVASSGLDRLKKLLRQMKEKGFNFTRTKNYYYFEREPKTLIILPMNLHREGVLAFLKGFQKNFVRKDLEDFFQIQTTTALRWIKDWEESHLITIEGSGRETVYYLS